MPFAHLPEVLAKVTPLADRFVAAGHRLYLVGGIVRDQWLDHPLDASSDIDLTTDADPTRTKALVADLADALWTQGERFGTIGVRFDGMAIEITTHRAEDYDPDSRKPEVAFGDDVFGDLSRRDFTVNAMAIEIPDGTIVDPYRGVDDLVGGRLRTPLSPEISFSDDPLRMLRAARFAARFDLGPSPELTAAATALRTRLGIVAVERIGDELARLFGLPAPGVGVDFLVGTGLAAELLGLTEPEIATVGLGPVVDAVTDLDWRSRLAAFLLTYSTAVGLADARWVADAVVRLRLSKDDQRRIIDTARAAIAALAINPAEAPSLRRWHASTGHHAPALSVAAAIEAHANTDAPAGHAGAVGQALHVLDDAEGLGDPGLIDGASIMRLLDIEPGPDVGEAVDMLRDAFFEHGPILQEDQERRLRDWWNNRTQTT
ncbi:MAG: hypothetical protein AAF567_09350 [Actinomycetota bacterium]